MSNCIPEPQVLEQLVEAETVQFLLGMATLEIHEPKHHSSRRKENVLQAAELQAVLVLLDV